VNKIWLFSEVMGGIGLNLQEWKWIDTAKWAETVGQFHLQLFTDQRFLLGWVYVILAGGNLVNFVETWRKLINDPLSEEARKLAKWDRVASFVKSIFWGAEFLYLKDGKKIKKSYIYVLSILAESLGIGSAIFNPSQSPCFERTKRTESRNP
jgi:hypothetical protein